MPERGDHGLLAAGPDHASARLVPHPGLCGVSLEPPERLGDGAIVGGYDARIPADERDQGYGFGYGEGEVAPGPVVNLSLPGPAA